MVVCVCDCSVGPVSYTHLDVYKRQRLNSSAYLQTVGFEVAASPDTFTILFRIYVGAKQF